MSTQTKKGETLTPELSAAVKALAVSISGSAVFQDYLAAKSAFESDEGAAALLSRYDELERKINAERAWREPTEEELTDRAAFIREANEYPVIVRYVAAQEALVETLRSLDAYTAESLGFDFASQARPSCGCHS